MDIMNLIAALFLALLVGFCTFGIMHEIDTAKERQLEERMLFMEKCYEAGGDMSVGSDGKFNCIIPNENLKEDNE